MISKNLAMFVIGISIVIVLFGMFYIGAAVSCNNSGGKLINWIKDIKCSNIENIGVCEYEGELFTFDGNYSVPPIKLD